MDVRLRFVQEVYRPGWSVAEVCRRYRVSRKTGYKWLERYEKAGPAGLGDRSHRPYSCPHATPTAVVDQILALQRRYRWGARRVRWLLAQRVPIELVPTVATVLRILERHGRTGRRRRSHRRFHAGRPDTAFDQPNAIWTADFKGQFRTGNGVYCYPLTVQDGATRFLLGSRGLLAPTIEASGPMFARLFHRYGLPERIRTDNGAPRAEWSARADAQDAGESQWRDSVGQSLGERKPRAGRVGRRFRGNRPVTYPLNCSKRRA